MIAKVQPARQPGLQAARRAAAALSLLAALVLAAALASAAGAAETARAPMNSSLRFLQDMRALPPKEALLDPEVTALVQADRLVVTVKFARELSAAQIAEFEARGCLFYRLGGAIAHTRAIYPLQIPWQEIDAFARSREVLQLEAAWSPAVLPMLDVSVPEVGADAAWQCQDPGGMAVTGKGVRVADFDTGVDVLHPSFFFADGDTFDWYELSGTGRFVDGQAFIDLDGNGRIDPGEALRLREGWILDWAETWGDGPPANNDGVFQPYWDWLYADTNGNGARDCGPAAGYTDADPGFGEPIFIALDANGNGAFDTGERLVQLRTSKIYATVGTGSIERIRGLDLIQSDPDFNGHGTAVMGIIAGGMPGRHRFAGIAPDAELLAGNHFRGLPISFLIPWARFHAADVMLYEFGSFVWQFLDGSSLDEQLIAIENETTIQITPSGNLGRGNKHAIAVAPGSGYLSLPVRAVATDGQNPNALNWTTLWRAAATDLTFTLESPRGGQVTLTGGAQAVDGYSVWSNVDTSPRATCKLDVAVQQNQNQHVLGYWRLSVANQSERDIEVTSNVTDNRSTWGGGAEFLAFMINDRNVTWPATTDSAFCNGSYSTRGFEDPYGRGYGSVPAGALSKFSGRGARSDGKRLLDLVSPGNYDIYTTMSHQTGQNYPLGSYCQFSGTSAAGPHVAAAAALVKQAFVQATAPEIEAWLIASAHTDAFTGPVYNDWWGWGKLRIGLAVADTSSGTPPSRLLLDQNRPNPFNPATWLSYHLPRSGSVSLKIYDMRGAVVRVLCESWQAAGTHAATWDGKDLRGRQVASGIYFSVLEQGGERQTRKLTRVQ